MLFRFILTKIEYFYREKPLHLNTRGQLSGGKNKMLNRLILTKIEYFYRETEKPLHLYTVVQIPTSTNY